MRWHCAHDSLGPRGFIFFTRTNTATFLHDNNATINLENAVKNHFTAKTPRAQRTYSKDKAHLFGEDTKHTLFYSKPCFSYVPQRGIASSRLCGGSFIPTAFSRINFSAINQVHHLMILINHLRREPQWLRADRYHAR